MKAGLRALLFVALLFFFAQTPFATAQKPADVPQAPIPTLLSSAKTAFISNLTGQFVVAPDYVPLTYNAFYLSMKDWGRYQLVASPADADMIVEIQLDGYQLLALTLREPKTHAVLWTFREPIEMANRRANRRKNFDQAMAALMDDFKSAVDQSSKN